MTDADTQQFQVDLRGVVDLLSRHIYSSPRVYLRELLQNSRDAITARREVDGSGGSIRITPISATSTEFVLRDDGVGLTADEATELLATVGRSSKRDIFDLPRSDYLGQFGIGLLSCFMVADQIVIRSRSARGGSAIEWRGNTDGTFSITTISDEIPIGTSVHLTPRFDAGDLLGTTTVQKLAETFAEFLPVRVSIDLANGGEENVTSEPPFLKAASQPERALEYGRGLLGSTPFDIIELNVPGTGTEGLAYVLPFTPPPGRRQSARVYLGQMLLNERVEQLLPEWAFFVQAVVSSTHLTPTASRESLTEDEGLEHTRAQIGETIRRWVLDLGLTAPHRMAQFVSIHELSLKSLVRHDEELARFITRWLTVETTLGTMTLGSLAERFSHIRYTDSVDEFRQIASICTTEDDVLVNGGFIYDGELVRMLPTLYPELTVEKATMSGELNRLNPPPAADKEEAATLAARASVVLRSLDCSAVVRSIDALALPAVYVADPEVLRSADRKRAKDITGSVWSGVLARADEFAAKSRESSDVSDTAQLCLNWAAPLVRKLSSLSDEAVFSRTVQLLYIQALLAGHRPLGERDRALLTSSLSDLIALSAEIEL